MKRLFTGFLIVVVGASLLAVGCTPAAPAPAPTSAPAAPKAAEPTKASAPAPAQPSAAPAQATTAPVAKSPSFPDKSKSITIIVPFGAGGSTDVGARIVAPIMEKDLGIPVQVVNKVGAGGQVGIEELSQAKPDGYTIGYTSLPGTPTLYLDAERRATFTRKSFVPLGQTLADPHSLSVKADSSFKSLKDLLDAAKAKPGEIRIGSTGLLTSADIALLQTQKAAGVQFRIVRLEGGAQVVTNLLGGHAEGGFNTASEVLTQFKSGEFRVLGLTDSQESKFYPGVPTMKSQGLDVVVASAHILSAPAGTPKEVADILAASIKKAAESDDMKKKMNEMALDPRYLSPADVSAVWEKMDADLAPLIDLAKRK